KITIVGVPNLPGEAARLFAAVAAAEINVDMIVQNASTAPAGATATDISFTLSKNDGPAAMAALEQVRESVGFHDLLYNDRIGKVAIVGAGMRSQPSVAAIFFAALGEVGVNIDLISTSEIRVSVVCHESDLQAAVRAVHAAFELGGNEEAVVYAGTGR